MIMQYSTSSFSCSLCKELILSRYTFCSSSGEWYVSFTYCTSPEFLWTRESIFKLLHNPFFNFLQLLQHDTLPPYSNSCALCWATSRPNVEERFKKESSVDCKTVEAKNSKRYMAAVTQYEVLVTKYEKLSHFRFKTLSLIWDSTSWN